MIATEIRPALEEEARKRMTAGINQYSSLGSIVSTDNASGTSSGSDSETWLARIMTLVN